MLELWGMRSTLLLPSFSSPLWPRDVAPNRIIFMGQIELNTVLIQNGSNRTVWYLNGVQTNYLCQNESFEIELFHHLNV